MLLNENLPSQFQWIIVQMAALQKLQNSIQILIILWLVYPIHANSLFQVILEELSFCHFSPLNTSFLGRDSQVQLIFHLNVLVFQTNGKQLLRRFRFFFVLSLFRMLMYFVTFCMLFFRRFIFSFRTIHIFVSSFYIHLVLAYGPSPL